MKPLLSTGRTLSPFQLLSLSLPPSLPPSLPSSSTSPPLNLWIISHSQAVCKAIYVSNIYLSVCLSVTRCLCLSICLSLFAGLAVFLSIYPSLSVGLSVCLPMVCSQSVCLLVGWSVRPSLSIHLARAHRILIDPQVTLKTDLAQASFQELGSFQPLHPLKDINSDSVRSPTGTQTSPAV